MQGMESMSCAACELDMLTQEEAAARLQMEVGALQQQLSNERNLVVEAQSIISTTQVLWLPTLHVDKTSLPSVFGMVSVTISASTLT